VSEETVTFNLELNIERALSNARQLETLLYRSIALTRKMGLPDDLNEGLYKIQRMVLAVRMLHTAILALHAASGPIGWALAIIGILSGAAVAGDVMLEIKASMPAPVI